MDVDLANGILNAIDAKHLKTGGHSGLKPVELIDLTGRPYMEISRCLNRLYEENKFKVRRGVNCHLLFKA